MGPAGVPPDLTEELAFGGDGATICGIDEAGRGPLAGPVVAAAVVLDRGAVPPGIFDSKLIPAPRRAELAGLIRASAAVGVGVASVAEIDALNILAASELAMARALAALDPAPAAALVDGNRVPPGFPCRARAVVGGDATCLSIAAASIVAKVTRDALMDELAAAHPGYGWETNRGYATAAHLAALGRLGITSHHRRSFAPVAQHIADQTQYMGLRE